MARVQTTAFPTTFDDPAAMHLRLPTGLRLARLQPQHSAAAAQLMRDSFVAREPMTQAIARRNPRGVHEALGQVAKEMMHAAATNGTSLTVVAPNGTLAAVCANYPVGNDAPPAFPAPIAAIGSLLGALYALPMPADAEHPVLDVGILAVDARFARRGLATLLLRATVQCAERAGFHTLTAGATSVSQEVFAACGFHSWARIPYAAFEHAGTTPFASVKPFSARYPTPAAHLMGRRAIGS